ncbi:putative transaldolase [Clohesyomyces aquaticus]|uniref:Putative transaldolase n=1 Tax=Clohesyomyces aquaticus TaxID=1231657 RepID=A0A1Y1ZZP3_9PLEO|nr:putative transaldolase [Clohesyomyces aquaticus]
MPKGLHELCRRLDPDFDISRLCIKVPARWEGMQACRQLTKLGIKTLATTLHSLEQAILAAEAGCIYVSPFVHELRTFFNDDYVDTNPILPLCTQIQQYYSQHSYPTRVKACCLKSVDEAVQITGVHALTIGPSLVQALLDSTPRSHNELSALSSFENGTNAGGRNELEPRPRTSLIDDEAGYRNAYANCNNGAGKPKTEDAIALFSEYQIKLEDMLGSAFSSQG